MRLFIADKDLFVLFCKADAFIRAFELEYAFRQNRIGNFVNLYNLMKIELRSTSEKLQCYKNEKGGGAGRTAA